MTDNTQRDNTYWARRNGRETYIPFNELAPMDFVRFAEPESVGLVQLTEKPNGTLECRGLPNGFRKHGPRYSFPTENLRPDSNGYLVDTTSGKARQNLGDPIFVEAPSFRRR